MNRIILGVCALATAFAMTLAAPAPAQAGGGSSFVGGLVGGAAGSIIGNAISQPRYRYGYQPPVYVAPPPPTYVAPAPSYSNNCAPRNIGGAWCNVPACWRACGGSYGSFSLYDCSFQPYNGPRQRCYK